eukprot:m.9432 g.9432  ORF g.9432 m.9432 type:complete len:59 (-) comp9418_c0_seq1:1182-1358(-)
MAVYETRLFVAPEVATGLPLTFKRVKHELGSNAESLGSFDDLMIDAWDFSAHDHVSSC